MKPPLAALGFLCAACSSAPHGGGDGSMGALDLAVVSDATSRANELPCVERIGSFGDADGAGTVAPNVSGRISRMMRARSRPSMNRIA